MPKRPVNVSKQQPTVLHATHPANDGVTLPVVGSYREPLRTVLAAAGAAAVTGFMIIWICRRA